MMLLRQSSVIITPRIFVIEVGYYSLPRGKWSTLIKYMLDDENIRSGGNTILPEQHFSLKHVMKKNWAFPSFLRSSNINALVKWNVIAAYHN